LSNNQRSFNDIFRPIRTAERHHNDQLLRYLKCISEPKSDIYE